MRFEKVIPALLKCLLTLSVVLLMSENAVMVNAASDETSGRDVVIVIDPGHGGENLGEESTETLEKYRTLVTAQAMAEELNKYEGVKVFLTRTEDVDLSLKERAEFAASVHADMLISVHYNASEEHEVFGAEIWVPSFAPLHAAGYNFGRYWIEEMGKKGLHLRGIKTRTGNKGEYYGIIRESSALNIPAVILEHCHVDVDSDRAYADTDEKMRAFGRDDATAAARYFRLKSSVLGTDYTNEVQNGIAAGEVRVYPLADSTEPEECSLSVIDKNEETGEVTFRIDAADSNEALQYYDYSTDGGVSYGGLSVWPGYEMDKTENEKCTEFTITLPREKDSDVIARVYNRYDVKKESESCTIHFAYQDELKRKEQEEQDKQKEAALKWEAEHEGQGEVVQMDLTGSESAADNAPIEIDSVYPAVKEDKPDTGDGTSVLKRLLPAAVLVVLVPVLIISVISFVRKRRYPKR